MLMPGIFGESVFGDFLEDLPFFEEKDGKKEQKKISRNHAKQMMKTDIKENEKEYILEMELPGFSKEEVKAALDQKDYITISAKKQEDQSQKQETYIRKERYIGSCKRSFYIGDKVNKEEIKGEFKDGVLTLVLPKKDPESVKDDKTYITIEG